MYGFWLNSQEKCGQARGKKVGHDSEHNFKEDDSFALEVNEKLNEESSHHLDARSNELAVSESVFIPKMW